MSRRASPFSNAQPCRSLVGWKKRGRLKGRRCHLSNFKVGSQALNHARLHICGNTKIDYSSLLSLSIFFFHHGNPTPPTAAWYSTSDQDATWPPQRPPTSAYFTAALPNETFAVLYIPAHLSSSATLSVSLVPSHPQSLQEYFTSLSINNCYCQ
jgi:hypothetical protein